MSDALAEDALLRLIEVLQELWDVLDSLEEPLVSQQKLPVWNALSCLGRELRLNQTLRL